MKTLIILTTSGEIYQEKKESEGTINQYQEWKARESVDIERKKTWKIIMHNFMTIA